MMEECVPHVDERALRALAEAENTNKRLAREGEDRVRYANQALLRQLLPVFDNLELCATNARKGDGTDALAQALQHTVDQFVETLAAVGVEQISAAPGDPFDPAQHEAVLREHDPLYPEQVVTKVLLTGFRYHDRLLRASRVVVNAPSQ